MSFNLESFSAIKKELQSFNASLIAVSKLKPASEILAAYNAGQKIFGENYVQELADKQESLPKDIEWHFIGHLQRNKIKYIAPFISLIHGIDSLDLLKEVNKQAMKNKRIIDCLLQVYIAEEETKFGLSFTEAQAILEVKDSLKNVNVKGFMGMATNTEDQSQVRKEFNSLNKFYSFIKDQYNLSILSMGMTGDYKIALECGSNMVRIGSAIFGSR